jgi:hypothetical protein
VRVDGGGGALRLPLAPVRFNTSVDESGEDWQNCTARGGGADDEVTEARYEREVRDGLPRAIRFWSGSGTRAWPAVRRDRSASGIDGVTEPCSGPRGAGARGECRAGGGSSAGGFWPHACAAMNRINATTRNSGAVAPCRAWARRRSATPGRGPRWSWCRSRLPSRGSVSGRRPD